MNLIGSSCEGLVEDRYNVKQREGEIAVAIRQLYFEQINKLTYRRIRESLVRNMNHSVTR